jgi:polyisoprenoid-binding protein YceI
MSTSTLATTLWNVDTAHTNVQFKVKHMGFFDVTGDFQTFGGSLETVDDSLEGGSITAEVDVNSVNTNNGQRDGHLKSDDFFNAEKFPTMTFKSISITKSGDKYAITGDLTIRDVTQLVEFSGVHAGILVGMGGELRTGVQAIATINRKTFGLSWGAMVEGVNVVSDNVEIILNVQLVKAD